MLKTGESKVFRGGSEVGLSGSEVGLGEYEVGLRWVWVGLRWVYRWVWGVHMPIHSNLHLQSSGGPRGITASIYHGYRVE